MVSAPPTMPFAEYMTGAPTDGASLCVFTMTLSGWLAVTVTEYCVWSKRPGSEFGSMNCERPGSMSRTIFAVRVPSNEMKFASAVVGAPPTFWMMIGVTKPKNFRTMLGSETLVEPELAPTYEPDSARLPEPWCSLTTATMSVMKLFTTTAYCASPERSASLLGTSANDCPGLSAQMSRRATSTPLEKL